jgi:hypothetical protein
VDDPFRDMLKPKYIQELGILKEVLAASFTLAECCKHLLNSTAEGRELRLKQQKLRGDLDDFRGDLRNNSTESLTGRSSPLHTGRPGLQQQGNDHSSTSTGSPRGHQGGGGGGGGGGGNNKPGLFARQDTTGTGGYLHEDDYDFDDEDVTNAHVMCVVPLYQWVSMAPESFEAMRLNSLLFEEQQSDDVLIDGSLAQSSVATDGNTASTDNVGMGGGDDDGGDVAANIRARQMAAMGGPRTLADLKYSLREAGLIPPTEEEGDAADTDIIERSAIKRYQAALKSTPAVKATEENTVMLDMLQIVDVNGLTRQGVGHTAHGGISVRNHHRGSMLKPVRNTRHHHHHQRGVSGLSLYEETLLDEERANVLRIMENARTSVVRMNDDFCFGELYSCMDQRRKARLPSSAQARMDAIEEAGGFKAQNISDQSRRLRTELEEQAKTVRFRHNPVVSAGVDRGTAEGHLVLLDAMDTLPTHSRLMNQKKDEIHQRVRAEHLRSSQQPIAKSASASILGVVRTAKDLQRTGSGNGRNKKPSSSSTLGVSSSLPSLNAGASSLSHRLDVLHDVLNDGY